MRRTFLCKFFLGGVVACLASGPATGFAALLYSEDWESGAIDAADWTSWGYPDPLLQSGGNAVGNHSLDPNGDSSYLSGLVSTNTLTLSAGLRLSVDAYIEAAGGLSGTFDELIGLGGSQWNVSYLPTQVVVAFEGISIPEPAAFLLALAGLALLPRRRRN